MTEVIAVFGGPIVFAGMAGFALGWCAAFGFVVWRERRKPPPF